MQLATRERSNLSRAQSGLDRQAVEHGPFDPRHPESRLAFPSDRVQPLPFFVAGKYRRQLLNLIQSISVRLCSFLTTYQLGKRGNVPMTGTLYVASLLAEANPIKSLKGKLRDFVKVYQSLRHWNFVGCGSSARLASIPDNIGAGNEHYVRNLFWQMSTLQRTDCSPLGDVVQNF